MEDPNKAFKHKKLGEKSNWVKFYNYECLNCGFRRSIPKFQKFDICCPNCDHYGKRWKRIH